MSLEPDVGTPTLRKRIGLLPFAFCTLTFISFCPFRSLLIAAYWSLHFDSCCLCSRTTRKP